METIPKKSCQKVGFIRKTHGVRGEVVLEFDPDYEYSVEDAERYFVELDGLLVPFFRQDDGFRFKAANTAILTLDDVDSDQYAKRLVGMSVFLFKNEITDEKPQKSIQSRFLEYLLIDEQKGEIGYIEHIDDFSGNIVFTVRHRGNELLVSYSPDYVTHVDDDKKTIRMKLPEGLIA